MFRLLSAIIILVAGFELAIPQERTEVQCGVASWCGEEHRGKTMANGKPFNPDELTAASWFYPLGTTVRVTAVPVPGITNSIHVTITDRGPAQRLVREGRIIDLSLSAFKTLASQELGLINVTIEPAN